jgi:hypothetical protein
MIKACMRDARALDAPDLVQHCRTSYVWMCGELIRSGKFKEVTGSGGLRIRVPSCGTDD